MKIKKYFGLLLISSLIALSACANDDAPKETVAEESSQDKTKDEAQNAEQNNEQEESEAKTEDAGNKSELLVSVWAGPHADLQKSIANDYDKGAVVVDDVDYGNLMQKQLTSFQAASGSGNYDVVWVNSQWMKDYVDSGYILAVDDFVKEAGIDKNMYIDGLLEDCTFDGKLYGLPTFGQSMILAYDSEVFKENNLEAPKNIDELIEIAKFFKEQGSGIAMPAKQGGASSTLFSQLLYSDGGDYFDESGNLNLTGENAVYAAEVYKKLAEYSIEGSLAWHHDEVAEAVRTKPHLLEL